MKMFCDQSVFALLLWIIHHLPRANHLRSCPDGDDDCCDNGDGGDVINVKQGQILGGKLAFLDQCDA